ncbi:hypothetical protein AVEN_24795-1 [Araneus ventricosus]|uniref:Uncharacterized protein n=1 Tax=Araneus ventricosus TaxID=182803 RepID=A0A4Y2BTM6_ARAVE|nr:hypothetical protein AVEN_24795-1 [Araneus ventricosus]
MTYSMVDDIFQRADDTIEYNDGAIEAYQLSITNQSELTPLCRSAPGELNERRHDINIGTEGRVLMDATSLDPTWKRYVPSSAWRQHDPIELLNPPGKGKLDLLSGGFSSAYLWCPRWYIT